MSLITFIWGAFIIVFTSLGLYHSRARNKSISHFKVSESDLNLDSIVWYEGRPNLEAWLNKFNTHIDYMNKTSHDEHWIQALGYFAAALTAVFSLVLSIFS